MKDTPEELSGGGVVPPNSQQCHYQESWANSAEQTEKCIMCKSSLLIIISHRELPSDSHGVLREGILVKRQLIWTLKDAYELANEGGRKIFD